jgi:hypothetical protein
MSPKAMEPGLGTAARSVGGRGHARPVIVPPPSPTHCLAHRRLVRVRGAFPRLHSPLPAQHHYFRIQLRLHYSMRR